MIKEAVLIISFILTVGLCISAWVNVNLTAMLGLFTVSMLWLYQWLEVWEKGKNKMDKEKRLLEGDVKNGNGKQER